ncbi:MAG TPA: flagellar biosynthetic protein FliR [Alphaproteobacteria bacterium]|nr:flagellar biosynthetic protein FliR [Alphaproteobacteria bacterium]
MEGVLNQLLGNQVFAFLLAFSRLGTAISLMPGFGDLYVPMRVRLILGLALTFVLLPVVAPLLPPQPPTLGQGFLYVLGEVTVGLFLGSVARLLLSALDLAGFLVSQQIGLGAAVAFNPSLTTQGTLIGAFLSALGVVVVFATDTHHLMIGALAESYRVFAAGTAPEAGDMARMTIDLVSSSFLLGMQLSGPFLVLGTVFMAGLGLVSRVMPALQIFFISLPLQIGIGLLTFGLVLSAMLNMWLRGFEDALLPFLGQ